MKVPSTAAKEPTSCEAQRNPRYGLAERTPSESGMERVDRLVAQLDTLLIFEVPMVVGHVDQRREGMGLR